MNIGFSTTSFFPSFDKLPLKLDLFKAAHCIFNLLFRNSFIVKEFSRAISAVKAAAASYPHQKKDSTAAWNNLPILIDPTMTAPQLVSIPFRATEEELVDGFVGGHFLCLCLLSTSETLMTIAAELPTMSGMACA